MRVLITGASSGIGKALAQHYLEAGAEVIGCGRNQLALKQLAQQFTGFRYLLFDSTDSQQVEGCFNNLDQRFDLVILNAGNCEYVDVDSFDASAFERMMAVNVSGTMNVLQAVLPLLGTGSQLAIVGSAATRFPFPRAQAYAGSKAALDHITLIMQAELAAKGIDVSLIQPGFVSTPLTDRNDFPMPFCISAEQAAQRIAAGLERRSKVIAFPKRLLWSLKALSWLPQRWAYRLLQGESNNQAKETTSVTSANPNAADELAQKRQSQL